MTQTDQAAFAYLSRRDVSGQWRSFLRALLETLDANLDTAGRDALLRAVGGRMAADLPLPSSASLPELETRMNEALAPMGWGFVTIALDEAGRSLRLTHRAAPLVPSGRDATGHWLNPVLEGLYTGWLTAQQGGQETGAQMRLLQAEPGLVSLRYGS